MGSDFGLDLGPHAGFIIAAYAVTVVALAGTIAAILIDYRGQRRRLERLERRLPDGARHDIA